jgi:hypothetical protein
MRSGRDCLIVVIGGLIALGLCLLYYAVAYRAPARAPVQPYATLTPRLHTVTYRAEGAGPADVRMRNETGGIDSLEVALPYQVRYHLPRGEQPYLAAQTAGTGVIRCRIEVDGQVVDERESRGRYAVAICRGPVLR